MLTLAIGIPIFDAIRSHSKEYQEKVQFFHNFQQAAELGYYKRLVSEALPHPLFVMEKGTKKVIFANRKAKLLFGDESLDFDTLKQVHIPQAYKKSSGSTDITPGSNEIKPEKTVSLQFFLGSSFAPNISQKLIVTGYIESEQSPNQKKLR